MNANNKDVSNRTIYSASTKEIIHKQFLAGFMFGMGNFVFTVLSWLVISVILIKFVIPTVMPSLTNLDGILNRFSSPLSGFQQLLTPQTPKATKQ